MISADAVVFDLDGVLIDSEQVWDEVRREYVTAAGGRWAADAQVRMMGMSTGEWSSYLVQDLRVPADPAEVADEVLRRVAERYGNGPPLLPGAVDSVRTLATAGLRLGLASSSSRSLVALVLDVTGLAPLFGAAVSSEEVPRGKPAPDVYLEACRRLGVEPARCVAVEDSANGIRSAQAAGLRVIATPNRHYPPGPDALALATDVVGSVADVARLVRP